MIIEDRDSIYGSGHYQFTSQTKNPRRSIASHLWQQVGVGSGDRRGEFRKVFRFRATCPEVKVDAHTTQTTLRKLKDNPNDHLCWLLQGFYALAICRGNTAKPVLRT